VMRVPEVEHAVQGGGAGAGRLVAETSEPPVALDEADDRALAGARKLRELAAADVRQALATMAAGYSRAAVTMGHLALKRAIRHAEANDLVSRNVAALVDTPQGPGRPAGRPSP